MRFHDAPTFAIDYLAARIPEPVADARNQDGADRFVRVYRVGGAARGRNDNAVLSFDAYAPTPYQAAQLCEDVREALSGMKAAQRASPRVTTYEEQTGPIDLPDPEREDLARCTMTAALGLLNIPAA